MKNEFTSHQFETNDLQPSMSFSTLSNHQTVVKPRASRLNFYEGPIPVSELVNCAEWGKLGAESSQRRAAPGAPVYRWQRFHQTMLSIFPQYSVAIRWLLRAAKPLSPRGKETNARGSGECPLSLDVQYTITCSLLYYEAISVFTKQYQKRGGWHVMYIRCKKK